MSTGQSTVTETYRQYIYIYLPGIIGALLALGSVQLPLLGRKWSLVISAAMQGLSMAMYTQVKTTPGYVGLNALEYIMQTVSQPIPSTKICSFSKTNENFSTSTPFSMRLHLSYSTPSTEAAQAECYHV